MVNDDTLDRRDSPIRRNRDVNHRSYLVHEINHFGGGVVTERGAVSGAQKCRPQIRLPRQYATESHVNATVEPSPPPGSDPRAHPSRRDTRLACLLGTNDASLITTHFIEHRRSVASQGHGSKLS